MPGSFGSRASPVALNSRLDLVAPVRPFNRRRYPRPCRQMHSLLTACHSRPQRSLSRPPHSLSRYCNASRSAKCARQKVSVDGGQVLKTLAVSNTKATCEMVLLPERDRNASRRPSWHERDGKRNDRVSRHKPSTPAVGEQQSGTMSDDASTRLKNIAEVIARLAMPAVVVAN